MLPAGIGHMAGCWLVTMLVGPGIPGYGQLPVGYHVGAEEKEN
jgi:hypothetical protein